MKRKILSPLFLILLITSSLFIFKSCKRTEETVACFPNTSISVILNLNLPAYYNLNNAGGWVYLNEQSSGTRGLIAVRTAGGFKIYDRNAPHICPDTNTTLNVVDDIKIVCPKDNATWILITGEPAQNSSGSVIASVPPKTYSYSYNSSSNVLTIYN